MVLSSEEAAARVAARVEPVWQPPTVPDAEVEWRPADVLPAKAAGIKKKAETAGWRVDAWYAEGPLLGADGDVLQDGVEAVTLLFFWADLEAYAWWVNRGEKWELSSAYQLGPVVRLGGNDITHWLLGTEPAKKKEAA